VNRAAASWPRFFSALLVAVSVEVPAQATLTGRVTDRVSTHPIASATVAIEGLSIAALTDSTGSYRLAAPPGRFVLRVTRVGYAPARQPITVSTAGTVIVDLEMARNALELRTVTVTADPVSRARGELGTASVIDVEAIRNQMAVSLAGVLELLPGARLQPPGLDGPQQISLRAVPVSSGGFNSLQSSTAANPSAEQLAAFGTQIVLDGVPVSNNANLQTLGARAELALSTTAGSGIDLRRIPAATIERVEVIRGIPSARFGDLTQGVVLVDTRAGAFDPIVTARADAKTTEVALAAGHSFGQRQTASITSNVARTIIAPGFRDDHTYRLTTGIAHRATLGSVGGASESARGVFDTRVDLFHVFEDAPGAAPTPDVASFSHDAGLRVVERGSIELPETSRLLVTAGFEQVSQRSFTQGPRLRPAMPFTDALAPGRSIGKFIGGTYISRVNIDGAPRHLYTRAELARSATGLGTTHALRAGTELRREWTSGAGYQFDIEFPPQTDFNGVQGYARPRRYDDLPPLATSAFYADDWMSRTIAPDIVLQVQAGVRADVLHSGSTWFSGSRSGVLQPRLNAELSLPHLVRLRAGVGRMAKVPSLGDLYPEPQFNDVVNVNWYANDPAERLAVLTTFVFDPKNPGLRHSVADRAEAGVEMDLGRPDAHLDFVAYADRLAGGVGIRAEPTYLLREHYALRDSTMGTGRPPTIVEPATSRDTVPIIIDRRANNLDVRGIGAEAILTLPEVPFLRTRVVAQGSLTHDRLIQNGIQLGSNFSDFQVSERQARAPYWDGVTRTGELMLLTTRVIHHQPAIGLVITGTIQHTLREVREDEGGTDTLSWAGYVTRAGSLVPVSAAQRTDAQYQDLRIPRRGLLIDPQRGPVDWLFSVQASKSLPADGRLSFYAFNALDKVGNYGSQAVAARLYPARRFGVEVMVPMPLSPWSR
jgi:hypothetical protein